MSMYLNVDTVAGRHAYEIATPKGLADFSEWAAALPSQFRLVKGLASKGKAKGSPELEEQLRAAIKAHKPGKSALAVAKRLIEVVPHRGTMTISDEPEDDELDEEDEDE
jgi:hypothetical protein